MTMTIRKQVDPDGTPVTVVRIIGERSNNTFLQIIRRAFNCWDRAPSDAKEFADMVEFGAPLQNYARQNGEEMLPTAKAVDASRPVATDNHRQP